MDNSQTKEDLKMDNDILFVLKIENIEEAHTCEQKLQEKIYWLLQMVTWTDYERYWYLRKAFARYLATGLCGTAERVSDEEWLDFINMSVEQQIKERENTGKIQIEGV